MAKVRISAHILPEVFATLIEIQKKTGITLSEQINNALYYYIKSVDIKNEIKNHELKKKAKKLKEINRCYYLIKNAFKTIIDIQMSYMFIRGEINLKVVAHQIKNYLSIAESFPEDVRENIKDEIKELESMTNIEYLSAKLKQIIPFKKNLKEVEWKKKK